MTESRVKDAAVAIRRAMELAPPDPSMLDMRNAILQAETVATAPGAPFAGSDDTSNLWTVFAHRGMGYFAATTGSDGHRSRRSGRFLWR